MMCKAHFRLWLAGRRVAPKPELEQEEWCLLGCYAEVSEKLRASIIRVIRIGELGTTFVIQMMEALSSSKTSVLTRATPCHIPEDAILHSHLRENLKSYRVGASTTKLVQLVPGGL
jgi:hypothetical protein